jgi:7-cyano-7-deazaguanine synthase
MVCIGLLLKQRIEFLPLFVNYGQRNRAREYGALVRGCAALGSRRPLVIDVSGFGSVVRSGLTDDQLDVVADAFTPNRNLLFLLLASSVAYQRGASRIVLGFLSEETAIFPDQTDEFLKSAESSLSCSLGLTIEVVAPLRGMRKSQVVQVAKELGISGHYSCHAGGSEPCGECIACLEYKFGET